MTHPTIEHYRQAIEIARSGGTPDHPYEQWDWGSPECGTPCCIHGHACLVAGEPVKPIGVPVTRGIGLICWQTDADLALGLADVPGLIEAATDAQCIDACDAAGWDDSRIIEACRAGRRTWSSSGGCCPRWGMRRRRRTVIDPRIYELLAPHDPNWLEVWDEYHRRVALDAALRTPNGLHIEDFAREWACTYKTVQRDMTLLRKIVGPTRCWLCPEQQHYRHQYSGRPTTLRGLYRKDLKTGNGTGSTVSG